MPEYFKIKSDSFRNFYTEQEKKHQTKNCKIVTEVGIAS